MSAIFDLFTKARRHGGTHMPHIHSLFHSVVCFLPARDKSIMWAYNLCVNRASIFKIRHAKTNSALHLFLTGTSNSNLAELLCVEYEFKTKSKCFLQYHVRSQVLSVKPSMRLVGVRTPKTVKTRTFSVNLSCLSSACLPFFSSP